MEEKVKDVHEITELHEMLTFKNVCMTKSAVMASVAQDPAFKNLLQQDISITMKHCQELKNLLLLKRTRLLNCSLTIGYASPGRLFLLITIFSFVLFVNVLVPPVSFIHPSRNLIKLAIR